MPINVKHIKKVLTSILWVLVAVGCISLLVGGVRNKEAKICKAVDISITGVNDNFFIDKNDVYAIIKNYGGDSTDKRPLAAIDLKLIEKELEKNVWVKNAELYFDNNDVLKVSVEEREPIARIFTIAGNSFYIDSSCKVLPLSEKFSARLPIFTGLNNNIGSLSKVDSAMLVDVKNISTKIIADSFIMAMIQQIDILPDHSFEMIPNLGKQVIVFGDAIDIDSKFEKLKLFYKNIISQAGWNKYSKINLQYKNQVVASIRGAEDIATDSLRTLQLIQAIADNAAKQAADSLQVFQSDAVKNNTDSSIIEQSVERDDEGINPAADVKMPSAVVPPVTKPNAAVVKPANTKPVAVKPNVVKPPVVKPTTPKPTAVSTTTPKPKKPVVPAKPPIKKPVPKPVAKPTNDY